MPRVDHWHEALVEHLTNREWSEVQILNLAQRIARSALMSHEGVLEVLEYQQQIDEQIAAEKEFDRWAIAREMTVPSEGWGSGMGVPIIERTETAQLDQTMFVADHIQQRFEETL